jgi:hypothetical protein
MKGLIMSLGIFVCLGFSVFGQPISVGLSISETGQAEISTWSSDPFNAFSNEGAPIGSFVYTLSTFSEMSRAAKRKQKRAQAAYDKEEIIYSPEEELPVIQKTEGLTYSPFAGAQNSMSPFGFFMPFGLQPSINTWQEHNYTVRGYNCNGTDWYSSYYIKYRSNEQDYLDSAIWGSSYNHGDSIVKNDKALWKYWYNDEDQFSRIEIRSLEYPEEVGPNQLRTIRQFNYNKDQQLEYIITFTDTLENAFKKNPEEIANSIHKTFYKNNDSIIALIESLEYPESGQAILGLIQYKYRDSKLVESNTYSNSWSGFTKDSLIYRGNQLVQLHNFIDFETSHITTFSYNSKNQLNSVKSLYYVVNNQRETGVEALNLQFEYKTRAEVNKLSEAKAAQNDND